jgi:calcium-dependent protein kinase
MGNFVDGCTCNNCNKEEEEEENNDESESESKPNNVNYSNTNRNISSISRIEIPINIVDVKFKTDSLVKAYNYNPFDIYTELEELGEGAYGVVKKVCLKENPDTVRAMKIIPKENIMEGQSQKLLDEIKILKKLEHPNIMKIYEYFDDSKNIYIVSELCDQGDLLGKMNKLGSMSELVVKFLMGQILNAVSYLHDNDVFHGDIKLENVMLYKTSKKKGRRFTKINKELNSSFKLQKDIENYKGDNKDCRSSTKFVEDMTNYEVKLIDFGCSKFLHKKRNNKLSGIVGTSIYCSPEVIDDLYDERSDEWSCGVLMYILLCGEPPFQGETEDEIFANVKKGYIDFTKKKFNNVSENCIDLIKKLLSKNKKNRIRASEALNHKFFTENFNPNKALTQNKDLNILKRFISLEKLPSKLHEVVVAYCCFNFINQEEEKQLRGLFRFMDTGNKNKLTMEDFKKAFSEAHLMVSTYELKKIMNILDSDGSNLIEYQEFLRAICDKKSLFKDENLKAVFGVIDKDKKGYIIADDVQRFVLGNKKTVNRSTIKWCTAQIGMKKDTQMTFEQFCEIIRNNTTLKNDDSDSNDSIDSNDEDIFKPIENGGSNNRKSSKNIVDKIKSNKIFYNMTEGDDIIDEPNKLKTHKFHRINTTKG